jgi:tetratricopeptide (TPR) repeat protein
MNSLVNRSIVSLVILGAIVCSSRAEGGREAWEDLRQNGTTARFEGRYPDARRDLEAAMAQAPPDLQDLRRADLDDELAGVYEILGEWAAAEHAYRDAIVIVDNHPNDAPRMRATIHGDFGSFRATQGRLTEAGELVAAALSNSRTQLGERDALTATLKSSLGQIYLLQGRPADAIPLLQQAYDVHRATLPSKHLDRVVSESTLGYCYMLEGRYEKAEPLLQQAAEDARQFGESHPTYAFALSNLGDLYRVEGKPARSEPLFRKVLAIYQASLGPESLKVAETLLDISIDTLASKKYTIAEEQIGRALDILRKLSGPETPSVALGECRLANAFIGERKYDNAQRLLNHGLPVLEKTWPDGHFVLAECLSEMAQLEHLQHRYANAELLYQKAIAVYQKSGPSGSAGLALALQQYAGLLRTGRNDEAKALEKRARELQKTERSFQ